MIRPPYTGEAATQFQVNCDSRDHEKNLKFQNLYELGDRLKKEMSLGLGVDQVLPGLVIWKIRSPK